jgi:hypothetical protein
MMVNRLVFATINSGEGFDLNPLHTAAPGRLHASTQSKERVFKHGKCQIREHNAFKLTTIYAPVKKLDKRWKPVSFFTVSHNFKYDECITCTIQIISKKPNLRYCHYYSWNKF